METIPLIGTASFLGNRWRHQMSTQLIGYGMLTDKVETSQEV